MKYRALIDGFVGYGEGVEVRIDPDVEYDDADPVVVARPELFEPIRRGPGRPPASKENRRP